MEDQTSLDCFTEQLSSVIQFIETDKEITQSPNTTNQPNISSTNIHTHSQHSNSNDSLENDSQGRPRHKSWSHQIEMEYFVASLLFFIDNSYHAVSWTVWKPTGFFNSISKHLTQIFGKPNGKSEVQCKTKDQNLKKKYQNSQHPLDLIDVAVIKLNEWINRANMRNSSVPALSTSQLKTLRRYESILCRYEQMLKDKTQVKQFEAQIQSLLEYSNSVSYVLNSLRNMQISE